MAKDIVAGNNSAPLNNLDLAIVVSKIAIPSKQARSLNIKAKKPISKAEAVNIVAIPIGIKPLIKIIKYTSNLM